MPCYRNKKTVSVKEKIVLFCRILAVKKVKGGSSAGTVVITMAFKRSVSTRDHHELHQLAVSHF